MQIVKTREVKNLTREKMYVHDNRIKIFFVT